MASIQAKVGTFDPQFVLCHNPDMLLNTWSTSKESIPLFLFPPWKVKILYFVFLNTRQCCAMAD